MVVMVALRLAVLGGFVGWRNRIWLDLASVGFSWVGLVCGLRVLLILILFVFGSGGWFLYGLLVRVAVWLRFVVFGIWLLCASLWVAADLPVFGDLAFNFLGV